VPADSDVIDFADEVAPSPAHSAPEISDAASPQAPRPSPRRNLAPGTPAYAPVSPRPPAARLRLVLQWLLLVTFLILVCLVRRARARASTTTI
jgi:hypothetical protein